MLRYLTMLGIFALMLAVVGTANADEEFRARLSGDEEVPPVVTDTSGMFKILFNRDESEATINLRVRDGVRVTQAHLHCAPAGSNGPIVVFLAGFHAIGWDVDGAWIGKEIVTDTNVIEDSCGGSLSAIAQAMREGGIYVNVHTVANPGGEVRGQVE